MMFPNVIPSQTVPLGTLSVPEHSGNISEEFIKIDFSRKKNDFFSEDVELL